MVMEILDEYRGLVVIAVVIAIVIVGYVVLTGEEEEREQPQKYYYLGLECNVNSFNARITGNDDVVDFEGSVNLPFTILLRDDTYKIEAWYNDNTTTYGYELTFEFHQSMLLHLEI